MKTILLFVATAICFAQDQAQPVQTKYYKFDMVVREVDAGKVQNARNYSVIGSKSGAPMVVRAGERVPVISGGNTTFLDVGVNVDCRILSESGTDIGLTVSADISSADSHIPPIITQTKWNSSVQVALKKPTIIFSSESPTKKVQTQLEMTVTPLQ